MEEKKTKTEADLDIEAVLQILDHFAAGEKGRMKLEVSSGQPDGSVSEVYHHGRCDVGSPWATGKCYDVPETACDHREASGGKKQWKTAL